MLRAFLHCSAAHDFFLQLYVLLPLFVPLFGRLKELERFSYGCTPKRNA